MAKYRKIDPRIWNDEKFRSLSDNGKLVFLFLLTHPFMTALGAMRATIPGLAAEMGWKQEAFAKAFQEALSKGMAEHDAEACFVWLPRFLKYNGPESPNVVKAWVSSLDLLPECSLKNKVIQDVKAFAKALPEAFAKALPEAFAKSMPYQEQEQEPKQEQEKKPKTKNPLLTLAQFFEQCTAEGVLPIPETDKIFEYADSISLPHEFLHLCWREFEERYLEKDKKYADWRAAFRNCVRGNWFKLWWITPTGEYQLTTTGMQAKKKVEAA